MLIVPSQFLSIISIMRFNILLYVIAINLTVLVLQNLNLLQTAKAEGLETKIQSPISVVIEEVDPYAFRYCTVPVEVENDVNISGTVGIENEVEVYCTNCE